MTIEGSALNLPYLIVQKFNLDPRYTLNSKTFEEILKEKQQHCHDKQCAKKKIHFCHLLGHVYLESRNSKFLPLRDGPNGTLTHSINAHCGLPLGAVANSQEKFLPSRSIHSMGETDNKHIWVWYKLHECRVCLCVHCWILSVRRVPAHSRPSITYEPEWVYTVYAWQVVIMRAWRSYQGRASTALTLEPGQLL